MHVSSKLPTLTTIVAAIAALIAGPASAQSVEVVDELTGLHCTQAVEDPSTHFVESGCHLEVASADVDLAGHVIGVESTALVNCTNQFEGRFNEDGIGYVTGMVVGVGVGGSAGCANVRPCNASAGENHSGTHGDGTRHVWNATLTEPGATPPMVSSVQTCFITGQAINECEGAVALNVTELGEDILEAVANGASIPTGAGTFSTHCELTGHFDLVEEPGEDIHINHL